MHGARPVRLRRPDGASRLRNWSGSAGAVIVNDVILVLNAGSSSLKFAVYRHRPDGDGPLLSRGQVEGIGTAPRMSARDGGGTVLAEEGGCGGGDVAGLAGGFPGVFVPGAVPVRPTKRSSRSYPAAKRCLATLNCEIILGASSFPRSSSSIRCQQAIA